MENMTSYNNNLEHILSRSLTLKEWYDRNKVLIEEMNFTIPNCLKYIDDENINIRTLARMSYILEHYLLKENIDSIDEQILLTISYMTQEYNSVKDLLDEDTNKLLFISNQEIKIVLNKINLN